MSNEIQFLLYNMPNADGKVQVVIKDDMEFCLFLFCNTKINEISDMAKF